MGLFSFLFGGDSANTSSEDNSWQTMAPHERWCSRCASLEQTTSYEGEIVYRCMKNCAQTAYISRDDGYISTNDIRKPLCDGRCWEPREKSNPYYEYYY